MPCGDGIKANLTRAHYKKIGPNLNNSNLLKRIELNPNLKIGFKSTKSKPIQGSSNFVNRGDHPLFWTFPWEWKAKESRFKV